MSEHVQSFDNLDEMTAYMAAQEDMANGQLSPGQIALRDDVETTRYWVRAIPDWDLVIYGKADTVADVRASGVDFDPVDNRERGYLTGTAYSAAVSDRGESGDTHVAEVIPISAATFALAQEHGFPDWNRLRHPSHHALGRALATAEHEALGSL